MISTPTFELVRWATHREALLDVRLPVFVDEQNVPLEEEVDSYDPVCQHLLVTCGNESIACCRVILHDDFGQIGRIAVKKQWRRRGLGGQMLEAMIQFCLKSGRREVRLSAQVQALEFYRKFGFEAFGDEFFDAGIPHRWMRRLAPV